MEIKLDEIVTIVKLIMNSDPYAMPFWGTIILTLFYIFLKKMLELRTDDDEKKGALNKLASLFTLPKTNAIFITLATLSLFFSTIYLYYGKNKITNLQNVGMSIKTYCVSENIYLFDFDNLSSKLNIKSTMLHQVQEQFPSEFIIVNDIDRKSKKPFSTFIITDGEKRKIIDEKSKKLLTSFLKDSLVIKTNETISFQSLQNINPFFTHEIIYSFVSENDEFCYTKYKNENCIKKIKRASKPKRES
jgi:hypothetical protein